MSVSITRLRGVRLPTEGALARQHVRRGARKTAHYLARYDRHTLVYDCCYREQTQELIFTAPRLLNLWPVVRAGLQINGQPYFGKIKRRQWQRCEQLFIACPRPQLIHISYDGFDQSVAIRQSQSDLFAGNRVMFAMNKDNRLAWITDWVRYHINAHGLEGVVIVDNGSTDYSCEQLATALAGIAGLRQAAVVHAPFPYGPVDNSGKAIISPRFLQTAMMNLLKQDMFYQAQAVLSVDIDELVFSPRGYSVFDMAAKAPLGAVSFREIKTFARGDKAEAAAHGVHIQTLAKPPWGNTKWCVQGRGFMNRFGWAVHRFGGLFFPLTETPSLRYLHCQATSTSWKKNRYHKPPGVVENPEVAAALKRWL